MEQVKANERVIVVLDGVLCCPWRVPEEGLLLRLQLAGDRLEVTHENGGTLNLGQVQGALGRALTIEQPADPDHPMRDYHPGRPISVGG